MALAREISKTSVNSFGCMQKETFGLQIVMNSVQKLFEARQLQAPDSIVLPHGCMAYMSLAKPENRIYALCGALAQKLDLDPKRELAVNVFGNNLQVFEHRPMNVSDSPHEVSILTRNRDVGNVWRIFRDVNNENGGLLPEPTAIRVIDHDKQRWATLTLPDALLRCGIWNHGHSIKTDATGGFGAAGNAANTHLTNNGKRPYNPLFNKHIIGDLISVPGTKYGDAFSREAVWGGANSEREDIGLLARHFASTGEALANSSASGAGTLGYKGFDIVAHGVARGAPTSYAQYMERYNQAMNELKAHGPVQTDYKKPYEGIFEDDAEMPIQLKTETVIRAVNVIMGQLLARLGGPKVTAASALAPAALTTALPATGSARELLEVFTALKTMMPHNILQNYNEWRVAANIGTDTLMRGGTLGPITPGVNIAAPIGASMEDLVATLQDSVASQVGGFEGTEEEYDTISTGIADILSRAGDWSSEKRYAVGQAIEQHAADFTKSIAKLDALKKNNDAGSSKGLAKDYVKALGSDFKSKWSKINASQKEIGKKASAAPIGQAVNIAPADATVKAQLFDFENLSQFDRMMGWVRSPGSGLGRLEQEIAKYWLCCTLDYNSIKLMDARGAMSPFGALVFRPFQSFNMGSCIVMKSGEQTGFTAVGNSDFQ